MKKNTLYLFILLLITGLNTSCNYLDIVPDETATEKDAFANPRAALRYLYSCYGYLPQSNMVQSPMRSSVRRNSGWKMTTAAIKPMVMTLLSTQVTVFRLSMTARP